jgi:hypothetical protein
MPAPKASTPVVIIAPVEWPLFSSVTVVVVAGVVAAGAGAYAATGSYCGT